jgi:hypothetical protein
MARESATEITPWNRRGLIIPPDSPGAWIRLAIWELRMGMLLCGFLLFGVLFIVTSRDRIVIAEDLSACYATTVVLPCERVLYQTGVLNAAFSVLCGMLLMVAAVWSLWELWSAVEPKPITDDFLQLLNESFGRNWRDPRTWPWSRMMWAYGFTLLGATLTATAGMMIWTLVSTSHVAKAPVVNVEKSQSFRLRQ